MKNFSFIVLILLFLPMITWADYSRSCLVDCFSTGHECKYCAYQCYREYAPVTTPYYEDSPCPLEGYHR